MQSIWLVIPAWKRYDLARVSFAGLRWALDELEHRYDIHGEAIVIADDANLAAADEYGFDTLERPNYPLGKKWNDGYEYACKQGADYVVPCGTDDWLDPAYLAQLPAANEVRASRWSTAVREDGRQLATMCIDYPGGDGIRIIPTALLERCGYRPAEDKRMRAIDTSVWSTLERLHGRSGYSFTYNDDPLAIVQFQSSAPQLNTYEALVARFNHKKVNGDEAWALLASRFPASLVEAAQARYA